RWLSARRMGRATAEALAKAAAKPIAAADDGFRFHRLLLEPGATGPLYPSYGPRRPSGGIRSSARAVPPMAQVFSSRKSRAPKQKLRQQFEPVGIVESARPEFSSFFFSEVSLYTAIPLR